MTDKENQDFGERAYHARMAFARLINGYCALHGINDADGILAGRPIEVDGVFFSLLHDEETQPGIVFVDTGYGCVPGGVSRAAYASLLEVNLVLHRTGVDATFAIRPGSKEVVLAEHFPLAGLSPEVLDALLRNSARDALEWRATFFLDKGGAAQAGAGSRAGSALRRQLFGEGVRQ